MPLDIVRSKTLLAINLEKRNTLTTGGSASRSSLKSNDTPCRDLERFEKDDEVSNLEDRADEALKTGISYRNRYGEEIVFSPCDPPPGYVFVPSGNAFITRHCRKLAPRVKAVYRSRSRKKPATQIGLHVPEDVWGKVSLDFQMKMAQANEKLWQHLDKIYPQMPRTDKDELYQLICSKYPTLAGKSSFNISITTHNYVRDRYTRLMSLSRFRPQDAEAIAQAREKLREILASWRGGV